jgi:hypothetical protein
MNSSGVKLCNEKCLEFWGNANTPSDDIVDWVYLEQVAESMAMAAAT